MTDSMHHERRGTRGADLRVGRRIFGPTGDWIATVGAIVVLLVIGVPKLFATPIWIDEAYTVTAVENLVESARSTHLTMSGYYAILWLWAQVTTSIVWLRTFSLICGLATLLCLRALTVRIAGRRVAAVAVLVLPFLAMFQWKATEARAYALEMLLIALCWLLVTGEHLWGARRHYWWSLLVLAGIVGPFLHGLFFLVFSPIILYVCLRDRRPLTVARATIALLVPMVLAFAFWRSGARDVGTRMGGGIQAWIGASIHTFFGENPLVVIVLFGGVALWLATHFRVRPGAIRRAHQIDHWVPTIWVFVPMCGLIILAGVGDVFNTRYLAAILPGLAALFGQVAVALDGGLHALALRGRSRILGRLPAWGGSAFIIAMVILGNFTTPAFTSPPWDDVTARVAADETARPCIIFAEVADDFLPTQVRPPFEVVWREQAYGRNVAVISSDRQLGIPRRFGKSLPLATTARRAQHCDTIWIVSTGAYGTDPTRRYAEEPSIRRTFERVASWDSVDGYELILMRRR